MAAAQRNPSLLPPIPPQNHHHPPANSPLTQTSRSAKKTHAAPAASIFKIGIIDIGIVPGKILAVRIAVQRIAIAMRGDPGERRAIRRMAIAMVEDRGGGDDRVRPHPLHAFQKRVFPLRRGARACGPARGIRQINKPRPAIQFSPPCEPHQGGGGANLFRYQFYFKFSRKLALYPAHFRPSQPKTALSLRKFID